MPPTPRHPPEERTGSAPGHEGRRRWAIIALGAAALLTYVGLISWGLHQAYDREVEFVRRDQEYLARVLERHALATVEKVDTVLLAGQLRLADVQATTGPSTPGAFNAILARHLELIPESQSLRVADASGRFIHDASGTLSPATIADRDYFRRNQADASGRLVISEPIFGRISNNWVITLSRRIEDLGGHFAGLIQAAIRADYFRDFYQALGFGEARSLALIDDQMRLVARYPEAPGSLGKALESPSLRQVFGEGRREAIYRAVSAVDGVERLFALRRIGDYPLYVLVGRPTGEYLAGWRQQALWAGGGAIALALVLTGWIVVWLRTYDRARSLARDMTRAYETNTRRTRALLDSLPDPAWLSDRHNRMIAVNEAYCRACGRPPEEIVGRGLEEIWPPPIAEALIRQDAVALAEQRPHRREARQQVASGRERCYEYVSTPVLDEGGQVVGVAGVARDITQIREDEERIRHLAEHDALTDLPNRHLLNANMARAVAEAVGDQAGIALMFLDLDHFKNINDTLGHDIGDRLLQQVAQRLRHNLHESDTVSRQGGDEFTVLLKRASTPARVAAIAQRLVDAIAPPFLVDGHELLITASIGVSLYPGDGADIGTLLKNADTAMYQAKAAGGNAFQFFTPAMNALILERVAMENRLRQAIRGGEFQLCYQPQVDGRSGELIGLEALVRWNNPEDGVIPPARFIPVAEESGLINAIGDWVLREACRQSRAWIGQGRPPVVMAVNLSAVQFRQRDLPRKVAAVLAEFALEPRWLELEVTESAFINDSDHIVEMLAELRDLGVRLSVDDFGTGYSSLGYLKRLPFEKIKIDQSFVRDLPGSDDDAAITRAIIGIAESLQKEVIAEGVETAGQRDYLLTQGCSQMQGYYFSRPLPAAEIEALRDRGTGWPAA